MTRSLGIAASAAAFAVACASVLAACGGDPAQLSPVAVDGGPSDASGPGTGGAGGSGSGGAGGSAPDGGAPKRTVETRNPFGNVAETKNLLWDGDFEWVSAFSDQYGWIAGPPFNSYALPEIAVGPMCRSGLKCAVLAAGKGTIGLGVASEAAPLDVSVWANVGAAQDCSSPTVVVTEIFQVTSVDPDVMIPADAPPSQGWCRFHAVIAARTQKIGLYVDNPGSASVIVDDAVVKAAPGAVVAQSRITLPPALAAKVRAARVQVHETLGPHDPPPNAARRAFEAWRHRPEMERPR